jgi:hypothetical protein
MPRWRQAGRRTLLHVEGDLVDEEEDVLVPVVGGHGGGGGWVSGVSDHITRRDQIIKVNNKVIRVADFNF